MLRSLQILLPLRSKSSQRKFSLEGEALGISAKICPALIRYDRLALQACLKSSGHFQECRHEGCPSGQILHPEKDSYMICEACNQRTCFKCDVPWHGGITCEEYQASRVQQETLNSQIEASETYISTQCKLCPKCKAPGKKETGCDHVRCGWLCSIYVVCVIID